VPATSATSTRGRKAALKAGRALPPARPGAAPGYPITSGEQWEKARQAVGRVKDPARRAKLAGLLRKTAPAFGKQKALAQSWAAPGGAKTMSGQLQGILLAGDHSKGTAMNSSAGRPVTLAGAVTSPSDVVIARGANGRAEVRHRRGGGLIGEVYHKEGSTEWVSGLALARGRELAPHTHQRAALAELIGTHNKFSSTRDHLPDTAPLQPPATQTPLMQQWGIPAVRALATPTNGASDGPTMTSQAGNSDSTSGNGGGDTAGLTAKGIMIYKKLKAKGWPAARCLVFARRAQSFGGKQS
jgi:hypothetical protein